MPFINFPDNPSIGDVIFIGLYKYTWSGDTWDKELVDVESFTGRAVVFRSVTIDPGDWTEVTIGDWTGNFIANKTVSGIEAGDTPIMELDFSEQDALTASDVIDAFDFIFGVQVTSPNQITFYADQAIATAIPINITVVR
jgi:hypothetical protein